MIKFIPASQNKNLRKKLNTITPNNKFVIVNLYDLQPKTINNKPKCKFEKYHTVSYQEIFQKAAKDQKIFTLNGCYPQIRKSLLKRGWIEKCSPDYLPQIQSLPHETLLGLLRAGNIYETVAISKLADNYTPKFIWQRRHHQINNSNNMLSTYRNCIKRSDNLNFTSKHGINNCIENSYWHTEKGLSEVLAPRFHCISNPEEYLEFLRDYRTTYCCSLLKYIIDGNPSEMYSENGELLLKTIQYAMNRIHQELLIRTTSDIYITTIKNPFGDEYSNESEWSKFYSSIDLFIHKHNKIKVKLNSDIQYKIHNLCIELIDNYKNFCPLLSSEGYNNLWILKPGFSSQGRGIYIKNNFHDIMNYVNRHPKKKYVLQKYIEEPLLIYKTKFDIRQHILITIMKNKFNIWVYKDCYLRFCSQEYDLNNLSESIHLTNRSIQQKYENGIRNPNLPIHNMWSLCNFKKYLKSIKKSYMWEYKIYPGIKKNIIGVIMASLEETELVENKFDLYGCDFMLNKLYETILIEINQTPDMSATTRVTAKLCPIVLDDLIKVVVDLPNNDNTDIGNFELIYSVDLKRKIQPKNNHNLKISVKGKTINIPKVDNFTKYPSIIQNTMKTKPNNYSNLPNYLRNYRRKGD